MNHNTGEAPPRLRTVLFKAALAELQADPQVRQAFLDQLLSSWGIWALTRVGKRAKAYNQAAFEMFLLMSACLMVEKGWTSEKVSRSMRYAIPQKLPRSGDSVYRLVVERDIFKIKDEYQALRRKLDKIQRRKWRNPAAHVMALKETLPGISDPLVRQWVSDKASDIAARYLGRKLGVGGEAVKKYIQKTHFPQLMSWLDKQAAKAFNRTNPAAGSLRWTRRRLNLKNACKSDSFHHVLM